MAERTQIRRGVGLAAAAALSFGVTVPLLKRASAGIGVFAAGSLLYLGAAAAAGVVVAVRRRPRHGRACCAAGVLAACSAWRCSAPSARRRCWSSASSGPTR